jgi:hypothetical protein
MYGSAVVIDLGSLRFGIRVVKGVVALYVSPRGRGWPPSTVNRRRNNGSDVYDVAQTLTRS